MALTDYISPSVLADEGYIHESQKGVMLEHIGRRYLSGQGYADLSRVRDVRVSANMAAEIIGIKSPTLNGYAKLGYIHRSIDGKYSLLEVLSFDAKEVKAHYLSSKTHKS